MVGRRPRIFERDLAAHDQFGEMRLERLHPGGAAGDDRVAQLMRLALADQGADGIGADQHLGGGAAAGAGAARTRRSATIPASSAASCERVCTRASVGNASTTRSTVCAASLVCNVAKTR